MREARAASTRMNCRNAPVCIMSVNDLRAGVNTIYPWPRRRRHALIGTYKAFSCLCIDMSSSRPCPRATGEHSLGR